MSEGGPFEREIARIREAGVIGRDGRLRELFDFLAARGSGGPPASQADIAHEVFGQLDAGSDDATVRVYVHRLRKRLDAFYAADAAGGPRLVLPAGSYELVLEQDEAATSAPRAPPWRRIALVLALLLTAVAAFVIGRDTASPGPASATNAVWQPFLDSERPIMVAVGDYYIFGEIDPFAPERSRLIRDYAVHSPTDLARAQESDPERYERAEDVGLSYLPFSTAYALRSLMPVLAQHPRPVEIMAASQIDTDVLRDFNIVYVGLVSGMGLLEDVNFMSSGLSVGETYDELVDPQTGRHYVSEEQLSLASTNYYRDFGYLARFREPGGALVAVVAGARDTGLRGLAPFAVGPLPDALGDVAGVDFEAVFEFTGQQGADLSGKLDLARERP